MGQRWKKLQIVERHSFHTQFKGAGGFKDGVTFKLTVSPESFASKNALRGLNFNGSVGPHKV